LNYDNLNKQKKVQEQTLLNKSEMLNKTIGYITPFRYLNVFDNNDAICCDKPILDDRDKLDKKIIIPTMDDEEIVFTSSVDYIANIICTKLECFSSKKGLHDQLMEETKKKIIERNEKSKKSFPSWIVDNEPPQFKVDHDLENEAKIIKNEIFPLPMAHEDESTTVGTSNLIKFWLDFLNIDPDFKEKIIICSDQATTKNLISAIEMNKNYRKPNNVTDLGCCIACFGDFHCLWTFDKVVLYFYCCLL